MGSREWQQEGCHPGQRLGAWDRSGDGVQRELYANWRPHLLGLHVYADLPAPPVPIAYAASVLGSVVAQERKQGEDIATTFAHMTAKGTFVPEWHQFKVPHVDLAAVVMEHGRAADLIIAG